MVRGYFAVNKRPRGSRRYMLQSVDFLVLSKINNFLKVLVTVEETTKRRFLHSKISFYVLRLYKKWIEHFEINETFDEKHCKMEKEFIWFILH